MGEPTPPLLLYRSYRLSASKASELRKWKQMLNRTIHLHGYVNALPNKQRALGPSVKTKEEGDIILLFEIALLKEINNGQHFFHMGTESFSVYPNEDQFVIDDGIPFTIKSVKQQGEMETIINIIRLESAPFDSKYIDKEYLNEAGQ